MQEELAGGVGGEGESQACLWRVKSGVLSRRCSMYSGGGGRVQGVFQA